jgi:hypothetical protein
MKAARERSGPPACTAKSPSSVRAGASRRPKDSADIGTNGRAEDRNVTHKPAREHGHDIPQGPGSEGRRDTKRVRGAGGSPRARGPNRSAAPKQPQGPAQGHKISRFGRTAEDARNALYGEYDRDLCARTLHASEQRSKSVVAYIKLRVTFDELNLGAYLLLLCNKFIKSLQVMSDKLVGQFSTPY